MAQKVPGVRVGGGGVFGLARESQRLLQEKPTTPYGLYPPETIRQPPQPAQPAPSQPVQPAPVSQTPERGAGGLLPQVMGGAFTSGGMTDVSQKLGSTIGGTQAPPAPSPAPSTTTLMSSAGSVPSFEAFGPVETQPPPTERSGIGQRIPPSLAHLLRPKVY